MAERLQQNIFAGVLPGSYLFIDNCEVAAKWQSLYATTADLTWGERDDGYFGKCLRFTYNAGVVGALDYNSAFRFFTPSGTLRKLSAGFIFRPVFPAALSIPPLAAELWMKNAYDTAAFDICFGLPATPGYATRSIFFRIDFKTNLNPVNPLEVLTYTRRISISTDTGATWTVIPASTNVFGGTPGVQNMNLTPWCNVRFNVTNNIIDMVYIDGVQHTQSIAINTNWPFITSSAGYILIAPINDGVGLNNSVIDIDQIWISDTENIV